MTIQKILSPSGETMVVLPENEYLKLVAASGLGAEDQRDADLIESLKNEETFPHSVVLRLLNGENPIKVYREHRGMTVADLSRAAGISYRYLLKLEQDGGNPRPATLNNLANALGVDPDDLTPWPQD
ncbi:MAG: transcriptional regulator [Kordiimonas sp.]|nr:transcriptional regulator [Kordiimonas sp.]|tara:strand:+ start:1100 stop:1480 length:381 start_codon:yes stop_codon:yes gene_type:complete